MRHENVHIFTLLGLAGVVLWGLMPCRTHAGEFNNDVNNVNLSYRTAEGAVTLWLNETALEALQWEVAANPPAPFSEPQAQFGITPNSRVLLSLSAGQTPLDKVELQTTGILALDGPGYRLMLGRPSITFDPETGWQMIGTWGDEDSRLALSIFNVSVELGAFAKTLSISGNLTLTSEAAANIDESDEAWLSLGSVLIETTLVASNEKSRVKQKASTQSKATALADASVGPDILVGELQSIQLHDRDSALGITAYSIGTTSCNIGDAGVMWVSNTSQHPVISQNMYRLKSGRFEQIGMSWAKQAMQASAGNLCSGGGCIPLIDTLGVGCSDPYSAFTNGFQSNLGPRFDINAATGVFSYPFPDIAPITSSIDRRIQVHDADLDPALNSGAVYFAEAQYITEDDAAAGHQDDNASYRRLITQFSLGDAPPYDFSFSALAANRTKRGLPAIQAWQDTDAEVTVTNIDVPADRRLIAGYKVTSLGNNVWSYEYALQNLNSDRSAQSFSIERSISSTISNVGFHDIDHHSGSPISTVDWTSVVAADAITWSTQTFAENANANALFWGSLFNFRFEAEACPVDGLATIGLFKPGTPADISFSAPVPSAPMVLQSTSPADGAIDARQPSEVNGSNPSGWQSIDFVFDQVSACAAIATSDFAISVTGAGIAPTVSAVTMPDSQTIRVELAEPIPVREWTTITHPSTGMSVTIGFLPGDVNGDSVSNTSDIIALVDSLNGIGSPRPLSSTDLNRSGVTNASDITRLIDLLNGADAFDVFLQAQLPTMP